MSDGSRATASAAHGARIVLVDIEGTISPLAYVREVLFPYAAERLSAFVAARRDEPRVAAVLEEAAAISGGDPMSALEDWQRRDVKMKPLKTLQGWIWAQGYAEGAFASPLFPDALAAIRRWRADGLPIWVYSSGSLEAQDLFFRHSEAGDLRGLFSGFFDTTIGAKVETASYRRIAEAIGSAPSAILFLSDNGAELAAAADAGLKVALVVKDGQAADARWPLVTDFGGI
ncbi:MAG: acireductone synthase [Hyphomicrobiales bacterium]|nr:acireductone synthase [Hyphomicrobiales bacterium]